MPYPNVERPIAAPHAFGQADASAAQSQAAFLLLLGAQIRGDRTALEARAAAAGRAGWVAHEAPEELEQFPVPEIPPPHQRVPRAQVHRRLAERYGSDVLDMVEGHASPPSTLLHDVATRVFVERSVPAVAGLFELCLGHADPVVQVAAAASYLDVTVDPTRPLEILDEATHNPDSLVREVAVTALARVQPEHPRLRALGFGNCRFGPGLNGASLLVHGTLARNDTWWQPGGDFHRYIRTFVRPDLYTGENFYSWSGGYSDAARLRAAQELSGWLRDHDSASLAAIAHGHGGSVAMLATQAGTPIGKLVLLSCPFHVHKYVPDFSLAPDIVSVRVHLDLVVLAGRGGQRFVHPRIREYVLPVWFKHCATRDAAVWQRYELAARL